MPAGRVLLDGLGGEIYLERTGCHHPDHGQTVPDRRGDHAHVLTRLGLRQAVYPPRMKRLRHGSYPKFPGFRNHLLRRHRPAKHPPPNRTLLDQ